MWNRVPWRCWKKKSHCYSIVFWKVLSFALPMVFERRSYWKESSDWVVRQRFVCDVIKDSGNWLEEENYSNLKTCNWHLKVHKDMIVSHAKSYWLSTSLFFMKVFDSRNHSHDAATFCKILILLFTIQHKDFIFVLKSYAFKTLNTFQSAQFFLGNSLITKHAFLLRFKSSFLPWQFSRRASGFFFWLLNKDIFDGKPTSCHSSIISKVLNLACYDLSQNNQIINKNKDKIIKYS